jgi:multicomponent Na+:H+ antiporter subunit D
MINSAFPPGLILILGALPAVLLRGRVRQAWMLVLPVLSFVNLLGLPDGDLFVLPFFQRELVLAHVDRLSLIFGYIFHLLAFIANLYALDVEDRVQIGAGLVSAGAAIGAVFAGDLFTLFVYWELLTISATFLIMARRTERAMASGFRYFMVHVTSGLCLLGGILLQVQQTGSLALHFIGLGDLRSYLIFIGFGVNCAWPLLHPWLTDAYPEATVTGTVFLSAFTTKTAVYALARTFPGTEALIWIGAAMTVFPIFFAVIENDLRRVLAYSLINQVGFMVVGIGIGTELAVNGAVAHAFNDILFKALLFMAMGAVLFRTGKINATDLGGLYRSMPWTCAFCIVGAASISAFPLFSGFVSKSMVMEAAALGDMRLVWFLLLFASAGVFHHAGIKIPFFAFFSHDSGIRCKEAPRHMLLAMGLAAMLCMLIGSFPEATLYRLLPYATDYQPYTAGHVISQTQLLFFSALAFTLLLLSGIYPPEIRAVNLDADWVYRMGGRSFYRLADRTLNALNAWADEVVSHRLIRRLALFFQRPECNLQRLGLRALALLVGNHEWMKAKLSLAEFRCEHGAHPVGVGVLRAVLLLAVVAILLLVW